MSLPAEIWLCCQKRVMVKHVIEKKKEQGVCLYEPFFRAFRVELRSVNSQFKWRKEIFRHSVRGTWSSSTEELSKY